jgi:predicted dehydrogenase
MPERKGLLRLAIIGAGNVAPLHLPGYLSHPRCEVASICDPVEGRALAMAEAWGIPAACTDLDEVLGDPSIDAVEILTPTYLHLQHVMAALEAGKHVSCQKPLANSIDEARTMADAASASGSGSTLRVSECFRHYPPLVRAKELVDAGAIGRLTHLRIRTVVGQTDSVFQAGLQPDGYIWRLNDQSPGGHLFDDMIHKYATALWLAGQQVTSVQAVVRRRDLFFEPCSAIFEYEDDLLLGSMEVSYAPAMWMRSSFYGADEFSELQGDEGFVWVTRRTARPGPGHALPRVGGNRHHGGDHRSRRRLVCGIRRFGRALRRLGPRRHAAGDVGGRGHRGVAVVLRRLSGRQHGRTGRSPFDHRLGRARGMGAVVTG